MKKLLSILFVFALTLGFMAGEKRIVGTKINNQIMLLRVDMANYAMDCSTDGTIWSAIPGTSGEFVINDNDLTLAKLVQIPTASILGNVSGSTGNVTTLSASDLKTLIGEATTSVSGLMSSTDKTTLGSRAASGANSDITSLSALTTALSITQGGTGLNSLGSAGQVLTVNSGATALEFSTPSSGGASAISDLTDVSLSSLATGNGLVYEVGTGTTVSLSHFNDSLSDEVGSGSWSIMSGLDSPTYAAGKFSNAVVFDGNSGIYNSSIEHLYNRSAFTLEGWFYPTSYGDSWLMGVYDEVGLSLVTGYLALSGTNSSLAWGQIGSTGTTEVSLNTWAHIRIVRNGENFYVYLNGALEISGALTMRSEAPSTTHYLSLGALGVGVEGYNHYTGRVDEFRLLDEALIGDFIPSEEPYTVPSGVWKNQMIIAAPASPAQGDILYYSGSAWAKLAIGTAGQVLTVNSGATGFEFTMPTNGLLIASGSGYALNNGSVGRGTVGTKAVSMEYSSLGSGYGATGNNSTVGGGDRNSASASYSTVSGGVLNVASGTHSTVIGGIYNVASGNFSSIIGGDNNTASALYSAAGGYLSISPHYGGFSWGSGQFSGAGDCQKGWVGARIATSSTDAAILYLDGSSEKFTLVSGDHYSCKVHLIGAQADGSTGDYYALVKIKNVSGTTSLSGTVRVLEAWEGDANLGTPTIAITADDTNDCLQVSVTPANATATRWTAVVEYVKINY